jgi:hypothetical protein
MWRQVVSFFKWTYDTYKCEAQVRLAYNEDKREWRIAVLPQNITPGLFTDEIKVHVDREKALEECGFNDGFRFVGTIHHHCSASAFQSGTDHADEITQPGYHVTIGKLNTKQCDFHSRASFRGIMYNEVNDRDWLPYRNDEMLDLVTVSEFPEIWKERLKKRTVVVHQKKGKKGKHQGGYYAGRGGNMGYSAHTNAWDDDGYYETLFYEGFGVGAIPDELPHAVKHLLSTPQWLQQRYWFWDFMIATVKCCDTSDMRRCVQILPVAGPRWNQQCLQAAEYCKFIGGVRWKLRDQAHRFFYALLESKAVRVNGAGVWSITHNGQTFDPYEAFAYDIKAVNVADVLPESRKPAEKKAEKLVKQTTELKAALKLVQAELKEQDEAKEKKEADGNKKEEVKEEVAITRYEPTLEEMMTDFADVTADTPKALSGAMGRHPLFKALENLFQSAEFSKWLEDCNDCAMEGEGHTKFFKGAKKQPMSDVVTSDFATLIVLGLRATILTRNFVQQKTTDLMAEQFAVSPEALDELIEIMAGVMNAVPTNELQKTVEVGLAQIPSIRRWTKEHLQTCLFKSMVDIT